MPAVGGDADPVYFGRTFDEALRLLQEARDYLTVKGQRDASGLPVDRGLAYSVESMRLTSRLTQVMAWLIVQRAAHAGEIASEELASDNWRLGGQTVCLAEGPLPTAGLPRDLLELLDRSEGLYARIARLDEIVARNSRP